MDHENPATATEKLLELANKRGGKDNISVIVIAVESTIGDDTTEVNLKVMADDKTVPIAPYYEETDTVRMDQLSDTDPKLYNDAYGEGSDTNEPSQ